MKQITVGDLLDRYEKEVTVRERGADRSNKSFVSLGKATLDRVTGAMIASYRDDRLKVVTVILAIETGMRRGELLAIQWPDIDLPIGLVRVRLTKNGHERVVPLTPKAHQTLAAMPRYDSRVFPLAQERFDRLGTA